MRFVEFEACNSQTNAYISDSLDSKIILPLVVQIF